MKRYCLRHNAADNNSRTDFGQHAAVKMPYTLAARRSYDQHCLAKKLCDTLVQCAANRLVSSTTVGSHDLSEALLCCLVVGFNERLLLSM